MVFRSDIDWGGAEADGGDVPFAFVEQFCASMPSSYRVLFDPRSIRRHAAVAHRRGDRRAYAEVWKPLPDASAAICVAAQDRPGLLSAIAAALISHRLDVITALVFSRALPSGEQEAVDLLWVRRASPGDVAPIGPDEAVSVSEVLNAIVSGSVSAGEIASRTVAPPSETEGRVVVRFEDSDDDGLAVLLVEAPDRPGVLLTIALEVFQQGAQIVRSLVRTADGRAYNRFELVEFSGARLTSERRGQICAAVYAALTLGSKPQPESGYGRPSR